MKRTFILLASALTLGACQNSERNNRDEAAITVTDSISDTTERAQKYTADVDLNGNDKSFVLTAGTTGILEIESASLALQLSKSKAIVELAANIQEHQKKALTDVNKIAEGKGLSTVTALPKDLEDQLTTLKSQNGKAFDENYLKLVIADQLKLNELYSTGLTAKNEDLKAHIEYTLPLILKDLKKAQELVKGL